MVSEPYRASARFIRSARLLGEAAPPWRSSSSTNPTHDRIFHCQSTLGHLRFGSSPPPGHPLLPFIRSFPRRPIYRPDFNLGTSEFFSESPGISVLPTSNRYFREFSRRALIQVQKTISVLPISSSRYLRLSISEPPTSPNFRSAPATDSSASSLLVIF